MSGKGTKTPGYAASWLSSVENLSPYFASCTTPHEFSYPLFLQWSVDNGQGRITKVALRAEWKRSLACMESEFQVLQETAGRLTKEWDAKTHKQDEQSFFVAQDSKEKLERTRQQVHEAVDGVMAKRQRLTFYKEDRALDSALREDGSGKIFCVFMVIKRSMGRANLFMHLLSMIRTRYTFRPTTRICCQSWITMNGRVEYVHDHTPPL